MNLVREELAIPGVFLFTPRVFGDARGFFLQTWQEAEYAAAGLSVRFVQDNLSRSRGGTVRGLHYQLRHPQGKLVSVVRGAVMDVAVDLRKGSPTYRQWVAAELSADNKRMLMIPRGFGHGFKTLTDDVEFVYKVDNLYSKECDRGIRYNDPAIGVDWGEVKEELLSPKDTGAPLLAESDCNFVFGGNEK